MRKKKTPRQKVEKALDKCWREAVKERDKYTCQWCGKKVEGSNAHASHVVPRSNGKRLRWQILNGKCLCFHCHMNLWHKDPIAGAEWFKAKFPERYEYLMEEKAKGSIKFMQSDLEEMLAEF